MTIFSMHYFIVLARERSFTRAAQKLHITQQSLSAHIAALEQEFGCQLLVRRSPLQLTYAGSVFLRYANTIQKELDNMQREFCDITENQKGVLKVGVAYTRSHAIMPRLVKQFQAQYPAIEIELCEASGQELHGNLLHGDLDLAIARFPDSLQGIELQNFYSEEVVLMISNALLEQLFPGQLTQVAEQISVGNLNILQRCPFLLNTPKDVAGRIEREAFRRSDFQPTVAARSSNYETLLSLCVEGAGACFCPENLANTALSAQQLDSLSMFHLGDYAKYPIRFGYLKGSYQWNIISEFIRLARLALDVL